MDFTNDDVQIKRVPVGSLSESSVEVLVDDVSWKGGWDISVSRWNRGG